MNLLKKTGKEKDMLDKTLNCIVDRDGRFVFWLANVISEIMKPGETLSSQEDAEERINNHLSKSDFKNGPWRLCNIIDSKE